MVIRSVKRKARDDDDVIAIAVALTLSNQFHIDSHVLCVVGTVLMLYHLVIERPVLAAVTFIRYR